MITLACLGCQRILRVTDELADKEIRCPHCERISIAPAGPGTAGEAEATLPPSPPSDVTTTLPPAPITQETTTLPPLAPTSDSATVALAGSWGTTPSTPAGHGNEVVPGYESVRELGRGGMGVVYLARQTRLNRLVALKMILAGGHAGASDLVRFRIEAESIARLQHPNIVTVYEVGEHEGKPFFSLELCSSGGLDRKIAGTPLQPREAAHLVEVLANAMQAAHDARIIHRDLKPANVLLTADGTPKITDFGLAKKLDDVAGQTQSGDIMGTPSYMAPEQAGGKTDEMGPACDIYALGAILYELLTGRPPFRAATPLDTILQVINEEPVPPAQLQSKVPRDLETICLKCLQKAPNKRYSSSFDLAQDLARFLAGKPVLARPVGRLERGWRWCKRNPVVAGLTGAVAAVLLVGASVSTYFAVDASDQATQARQHAATAQENAATATRNEATAQTERAAAVAARNDLEKSNDRLTTSVARSLLRPLAVQAQPNQPPPPLSDPEIESLWELASSPEDRLRLRFVKEALRGPVQARQLKDRAALALHAAVGLDGARRKQVEQMLAECLVAKDDTLKQDVALTLAQFGALDSSLAGKVGLVLAEALTRTTDVSVLSQLPPGLSAVAPRLGPKDAKAVATTLALAMSNKSLSALEHLARGLSAVVGRMEPKEAAAVATALTLAMSKTKNALILQQLAEFLSVVATQTEPKEAARVCAQASSILVPAMSNTKDVRALVPLAQGLSAVAARLEPKEAKAVAAAIVLAMSKTADARASSQLSQELSAVLLRKAPSPGVQRRLRVSGVVGAMNNPAFVLVAPALLRPALEPLPPPMPPQTLVDLLKHPLFVGEPRQQVLNQLARHYRHPFADRWELVRFATERKLTLDFTTPPQGPGLLAGGR